jgi:hypothetical protein
VFGGEGGSETGVTYFDLIAFEQVKQSVVAFHLVLDCQVLNHLQLLLEVDAGVSGDLINPLLQLLLLLLELQLLLLCLGDISCAYHCDPHIRCPQSTHIIGAVSCVEDAFACKFLDFLDNFLFVLWGGPGKDGDLWVVLRLEFLCR